MNKTLAIGVLAMVVLFAFVALAVSGAFSGGTVSEHSASHGSGAGDEISRVPWTGVTPTPAQGDILVFHGTPEAWVASTPQPGGGPTPTPIVAPTATPSLDDILYFDSVDGYWWPSPIPPTATPQPTPTVYPTPTIYPTPTPELSVDSVSSTELKDTNSPTDEYCYTYEATGTTGEWQICGGGNGDGVGEGHITILPFSYASIGQGTWLPWLSAIQFLQGGIRNTSEVDGDNISYNVYLSAGTYTLLLFTNHGASFGIMDIDFNGDEVASFDLYNASAQYNQRHLQVNIVVSTSGLYTVLCRADGKNEYSAGFYVSIGYINLWRTS